VGSPVFLAHHLIETRKGLPMNKAVGFLNKPTVVAIVVALVLYSLIRRFV